MTRIKRLEFSKKVKIAILRRAGWPENPICEGCGMPMRGKRIEVDHTIECWEQPDRQELTEADGKALGWDCCHQPKSSTKTAQRAHGNRIIEKAARARPKSRPIPGSKASGLRKGFNGIVEKRT
jgi:hypothetical protein